MEKFFDVIVVGAGHAGCESALASARLNKKTILFATNLDTVAFLACNPSIGGTAKGQIVREIDALGGEMALNADKSILQMRMLNMGKGAAVHSPRAQVDKQKYHQNMKLTLETTPNLTLRQGEVVELEKNGQLYTVTTAVGQKFVAPVVVLCCGVYLNSLTFVGEHIEDTGPSGFANAKKLSKSIEALGFKLQRLKTGTPARVKFASIDTSKTSEQVGEVEMMPFSFKNTTVDSTKRSCYLTYTTPQTKEIILANKEKAPIYNGGIDGVGPRYCPSIEDKVVRFADKERHQVFLEPEGEHTTEFYVQGASSSMPAEIQEEIYKTIDGLENVEIMRDAYAIEYDAIDATMLDATLMSKAHAGLFFAGQINGTSGYEEAACQGLVAGINAVRFIEKQPPFVLTRNNSYIGVLIDDITTKENHEPYRMMTSRAEHRLVLRQDNADLRLTELGREVGLVDDERYNKFQAKLQQIANCNIQLAKILPPKALSELFSAKGENLPKAGLTANDLLKRSNINVSDLQKNLNLFCDVDREVLEQIEINAKYEGYIAKQLALIETAEKQENKLLPKDLDYSKISGLRIEAQQKLNQIKPQNLGQASRVLGVSPADIQVLIVWLSRYASL